MSPREIPSWDRYYLDVCKVVGARSKDPNTQLGCIIVGPNHEIRSTGYNSFPRGIRDDVPERLVRPAKYLWIEHAERNAICNAARNPAFEASLELARSMFALITLPSCPLQRGWRGLSCVGWTCTREEQSSWNNRKAE